MEAVATPPLLSEKTWQEISDIVANESIPLYLQIVRNKNFSEATQEECERKNHKAMTQRLYSQMLAVKLQKRTTFFMVTEDVVAQAAELISIFQKTYPLHYPSHVPYTEYVQAEMSYTEKSCGAWNYTVEKNRRNEHANLTLRHYEAMILQTLKERPGVSISQEEAEMWVYQAGQFAERFYHQYKTMYLHEGYAA